MCLQFSQIEGVLENFYGTKPKIQCVHPKVHNQDESINYSLPGIYKDTLICCFCLNRMLTFRFWGRLRSVSTLTSPSWTARDRKPWKHCQGASGASSCLWTDHQSSVCVTMTCPCTTHLSHHTIELQNQRTPQLLFTHTPATWGWLESSHPHVQCHTLQSVSPLTVGSIFNNYQ